MESQLADDSLYQDENKETLKDLLWNQAELSKSMESIEEEWMSKAEQLEQMMNDTSV